MEINTEFKITPKEYFDSYEVALFDNNNNFICNIKLNNYKSMKDLFNSLIAHNHTLIDSKNLFKNYFVKFINLPMGLARLINHQNETTYIRCKSDDRDSILNKSNDEIKAKIDEIKQGFYEQKLDWSIINNFYFVRSQYYKIEKSFDNIFSKEDIKFKNFDENFKFEYILALAKTIDGSEDLMDDYINYKSKDLFFIPDMFYQENDQSKDLKEILGTLLHKSVSDETLIYFIARDTKKIIGYNLNFITI